MLFEDEFPEGFIYTPLWLSEDGHSQLLELIDSQPWSDALGRRTQHYGRPYLYRQSALDRSSVASPLPPIFVELAERLVDEGFMPAAADQVIVNEYVVHDQVVQGIAPHIDQPNDFGPVVVTLSLLEDWSMRFDREGFDSVEFLLERRSIGVLSGEARYEWSHSIPARKFERGGGGKVARHRRVSVTFRTVTK